MSGNGDSEQKVFQGSMIKAVKVRRLTKGELDIIVSVANSNQKSLFGIDTKHPTRSGRKFAGHRWASRIFHAGNKSAARRAPNETPEIEVSPSSYLYTLASLLDKSTREMVFTPLIDDFHYEYFEALAHGRPTRRLIWVYRYYGTVALLRALCLAFLKQLVSGSD